jgi:hypothetical protein
MRQWIFGLQRIKSGFKGNKSVASEQHTCHGATVTSSALSLHKCNLGI